MKPCCVCGVVKPLSEYHKDSTRPSGHTPRCKVCSKRYKKANRKHFSAVEAERRRSLKARAIAHKGGKCERCEGVFPAAVYDFHHKDPTTKENNLSLLLASSWERAVTELDQCALLCANCHRITHEEIKNGVAF